MPKKKTPLEMQDALFTMPSGSTVDARNMQMWQMYGIYAGHECGDCQHFIRYHQGHRWAKCDLTVQTQGAATDWRARWTACGRFADNRD